MSSPVVQERFFGFSKFFLGSCSASYDIRSLVRGGWVSGYWIRFHIFLNSLTLFLVKFSSNAQGIS